MKKTIYLMAIIILMNGCNTTNETPVEANAALATMLEGYYNERMELFPMEATYNGDNRFNNLLPVDFTDSYRARLWAANSALLHFMMNT